MVEKIVVAPNEVRGYGNIVDNDKDKSDLCFYNSFVNADTDLIDGIRIGIMRMIYQDPNLFFSFHQLEKYLYVNSDDMTLSFDSNNKRLVFDDTTESFSLGFDSTNKVLYIGETGEHNYSIAFSQSSYTASGGSATLEITLLDSNVPVQSASVTVTGSDSSSYTGITNSQGLAEITVSNITGTVSFTASYSNVTDTCTVIGESYLFYDACDSSAGLTNYGTSILLEGGSNATMTYDSTENAYKITTPDNKSKCIPIDVLTDEDNFKFEADIKPVSRFGMGFSVSGGTGNGCVIGFSADSDKLYGWKYTNGIFGTLYSDISGLVDTGYLHITVTVTGTSLDVSISDTNNTTKIATATLPSYSTRYVGIGLGSGTSNQNGYIKNIKVESL